MPEPARGKAALALLAATSVCVSSAATLLAGEVVLRLRHGGLLEHPSAGRGPEHLIGRAYPGIYDSLLGHAPRPGTRGRDNVWGYEVTIDAAGLRENGRPRPSGRPVLAVGDSFTFGDEVDDADTWPAQLEAALGRPVLNGGVFGYGFDQVTLRAERLLDSVAAEADVVIVALIPEDVIRCEFAYRFAWKPYFDIENDELVLRNVPVPQPQVGPPGESWLRRGLRYSFVADRVFRFLDPDGWAVLDSVRVHERGVDVARLLLDRLVARTRPQGRKLLLVIQWAPTDMMPVSELIQHARARRVPVVELGRVLAPFAHEHGAGAVFRIRADPGLPIRWGHLNPQGNRLVAEAIADGVRALDRGAENRYSAEPRVSPARTRGATAAALGS